MQLEGLAQGVEHLQFDEPLAGKEFGETRQRLGASHQLCTSR